MEQELAAMLVKRQISKFVDNDQSNRFSHNRPLRPAAFSSSN
jgi:hypothetical protein